MKAYAYGDKSKPVILLFPGTCCYWKTNFGHVLDGLQKHFYTVVISYSGFDDSESSTFESEIAETEKNRNIHKRNIWGKNLCSLRMFAWRFVCFFVGRKKAYTY